MVPLVDPKLEEYAATHSAPVPELLQELRDYTYSHVKDAHMIVDGVEGGLLRLLVQLLAAKNVLEIGTFTGYSALMMASALPDDGTLTTCEIDDDNANIAHSFFVRSNHGKKIVIRRGPAVDTLRSLEGPFDLIFFDADKEHYPDYLELSRPMLRHGGLLVADNVLWSGRVIEADNNDESTRAIRRFNERLSKDPCFEPVMLTVRDGLTIARKR